MLMPIMLTMGDAGNLNTPVETYPDSTNPYITEYLDPDISAHRSGAGLAPQNTLMAFENIIEQGDSLGENFERGGEYPYRGLRGDDIPYNLKVVTCDEIIDYVETDSGDKKYKYVIEIKSIGINGMKAVDKLYSIITERGLQGRAIWSTFSPDISSYMKIKYPDMPRTADAIEAIQFYFYYRMNWELQDVSPSYVALQSCK